MRQIRLLGYTRVSTSAQAGDTVVVWRVDRMGRYLIDVLNTVNLLRARGVELRSISDGIDPATTTCRLMLNMLATLAEYERELIADRVNAGIAAARAGGTRFGRPMRDPAVVADKLAIVQDARAKGNSCRSSRVGGVKPGDTISTQQSMRQEAALAAKEGAGRQLPGPKVLRGKQ